MAKLFSVSADNITYFSLPSPESSLSATPVAADTTLLGQTFSSSLYTIIDWEATAQGIVTGAQAYCGRVLKTGTSTASTGEAMAQTTGQSYQIVNNAKQIWDFGVAPVIFDDGIDVTSQVREYDYLFGTVTFLGSYTVVGAVTADINYLPASSFGKATSFSLNQTATAVDDSDFATVCANNGYRINKSGLRDISITFDGFFDAAEDFLGQLEARDSFILEIDPVFGSGSIARGYFRVGDISQSGASGDNEVESVTFGLSVPSPDIRPFGWQHASGGTLNQAIKIVLDGFDLEQDVYVRYEPEGSGGAGGKTGSTVVTDVTLESSIEDIVRFNMTFMGDGALLDI